MQHIETSGGPSEYVATSAVDYGTLLSLYTSLQLENKRLLSESIAKDCIVSAGVERENEMRAFLTNTNAKLTGFVVKVERFDKMATEIKKALDHRIVLMEKYGTLLEDSIKFKEEHIELMESYNKLDELNTALECKIADGVQRELAKSDALIASQRSELNAVNELMHIKRRRTDG